MKKRNILIISLTIIILLIAYFGYKAFNLKYYTINNINNPNQFNINNTITIKHNTLKSNDYFEYKNMKIRNDFKDYSKMEDSAKNSSTKLVLKDENNKTIKAFWMGITDTYVYLLKNDKTLFGTDDSRITNTDLSNILKKNNINNDIDLFNYLSKQKNIKNNLFTSIKKMKENYAIEYMTSVVMPTIDNITLINGDYEGYIFNIKSNTKEVSILKDNKRYAFIFIDKNNLTDEYLKSILSTIVID